jgi:hypothetical protein
MFKKNLKDVEDIVVDDLKNVSVESGKESTQRIVGSILKKHNVDFDHVVQKGDYLAVYKEADRIGNVFVDSQTTVIRNNHGEEREIEYEVFKKLEVL